ncbi:uncharacterized protein EKO05_0003162 [Ascochyta rabiei]|uniref:uncharacterized protein n=1 Tax=Didymella rabiei TaxID=5454 RepID=UPI001900EE6C|nr:uncharacterized protein EKO05_0003162 [Ascochyta rabiei]UPX12621.1 hypothetical protein EKO05_0003162 [Ascochyta rabiei]
MANSFFPLRQVGNLDLQNLGETLWDWRFCGSCVDKPSCTASGSCPWSRAGRLSSYWAAFKAITKTYIPDHVGDPPALRHHKDLLDLIKVIKDRPKTSRKDLILEHFGRRMSIENGRCTHDQNKAFGIAASILLCMASADSHERMNTIEAGMPFPPWRDTLSIETYMDETFPQDLNAYFDYNRSYSERGVVLGALSVRNLQSVRINLEATSDIRYHLMFDNSTRVLQVFHCTSVLQEILLASKENPAASYLPQALILELLDTMQLLFPPNQETSDLRGSLVRRQGFDADLLFNESAGFRRHDDLMEVTYAYFGNRLARLYDELKDPSPRNWFERLFEGGTKSAERKMLMATTIGVFIAVTIGLLGLVIAGFQAWVGYQQWKHPVKDQ